MKTLAIAASTALLTGIAVTAAQAPEAQATSDAAVFIGYDRDRTPSPNEARAYVKQRASRAGYDTSEIRCLLLILHKESRFRVNADNPDSTAYGLFQQLRLKPGTPMHKQVTLGLRYIEDRYGSACHAWNHHLRRNWY